MFCLLLMLILLLLTWFMIMPIVKTTTHTCECHILTVTKLINHSVFHKFFDSKKAITPHQNLTDGN